MASFSEVLNALRPYIAAQMQGFLAGTSFPASPVAGVPFYRTDRRRWYAWDGTRWLSEPYALPLHNYTSISPLAAAGTLLIGTVSDSFALWLERWLMTTFVATTNNASNYWTVQLKTDAVGTISSFTTASDVPNTRTRHVVSSFGANNPLGTSNLIVTVDASPVGSPGALYMSNTLLVRDEG